MKEKPLFSWGRLEAGAALDCREEYTYKGLEGCPLFDLNVLLAPLARVSGVLEIAVGLLLVFAGARSVDITFGLSVFMVVSACCFALCYNLGLSSMILEGNIGVTIGIACVCAVVGGLAGHFSRKFAKEYFVQIIGAFAAGALAGVLLAPFDIPSWANIAIIVVAAMVAYKFVKEGKKYARAGVTAFLGAVLLCHGISSFLGGFPSLSVDDLKDKGLSASYIGYIAGMIVATGLGMFVQLKYLDDDGYGAGDAEEAAGDDKRFM